MHTFNSLQIFAWASKVFLFNSQFFILFISQAKPFAIRFSESTK